MSGQPSGGMERYAPRHSMPATMSNIHEPPTGKNGRRISGLGYIRESGTVHQKRSMSHHAKSNDANYALSMDWSSPELRSDPFWSHRYPVAGPLYGFTPVDTIKANSSLRVPTLHRDANVYSLPRCDRYESYALGHSMSQARHHLVTLLCCLNQLLRLHRRRKHLRLTIFTQCMIHSTCLPSCSLYRPHPPR